MPKILLLSIKLICSGASAAQEFKNAIQESTAEPSLPSVDVSAGLQVEYSGSSSIPEPMQEKPTTGKPTENTENEAFTKFSGNHYYYGTMAHFHGPNYFFAKSKNQNQKN